MHRDTFNKIRQVFFWGVGFYKRQPKFIRKTLTAFLFLFVTFNVLNITFPFEANINYSPIILDSDSSLVNAYLSQDDKWRMYTELEEITPELKKAIIYKEDRFFRFHLGVNPVAIVRAAINNIQKSKRTSGASTITMQVVRLLSPRKRTYWNKFIEMFRALQLEYKYSKGEILQLYLNLVPYGGNIEGVKAASVIYFNKMPSHLSIAEIATLSIIPNRPVSLRLGKNNNYILKERNKWLKRYQAVKLFDHDQIEDALLEPLNATRGTVPHYAPHLSYRLMKEYSGYNIIRSTLNLEIQRKCEAIVKAYSRNQYYKNIKNATALIIENETRSVLAYIGSADFYDNSDGGQVDGIRAIRSPGSTLKPLVYGLAFDQGIATPKSIINDVPVSFSGYEPENYDSKFYGQITLEDALAMSLNVPAVRILSEVNTGVFLEKLILADFKQIKADKEILGLSTVLGGCGTNLEELSTLYCTFANNGKYASLNYLQTDRPDDTLQLISTEATYMVTEILTQLQRPDLPLAWENSLNTPKIAWKTGTSYGRRDAWSIGYNDKYTIGVWLGNFSAEGVPELSGAEKATPLLFRIFNAIDKSKEHNWFANPENIDHRYICSHTGTLPNKYCNSLILDYYIPGVSHTHRCNHLKKVYINPDSTLSYCITCRPQYGYKEAYYPNLPPEIINYYDQNQISYSRIPKHNPDCERLLTGQKPKIISPLDGNEYYVNVEENMEIMLSCQAAIDVEKIYWYINKRFFKETNKEDKLFFSPSEGEIEINCADDKGRSSTAKIVVKYSNL